MRVLISLTAVLATACLFSTTPPKPSNDGGSDPPPDPNSAVVMGQVLHFGRVDRTYRRMPGRGVQVVGLGPDRDGDGAQDRLGDVLVISDRSGNYRATLRWPILQAVELKAYDCTYDPGNSDLDCCIEAPPCPPAMCNIWTAARRFSLRLGQTLQQDMIVPCDQ
jgi:hypothetical protein